MIAVFKKALAWALFTVAAVGLFIVFSGTSSAPAYAQVSLTSLSPTPLNDVVIGWSTNTYVPPGFQGKRLPTSGSNVNAWITVFTSGKPASASGYTVRWYVNDQSLRSGKGLSSVSFNAPKATSQIINLQARVQSPSGELLVANTQVPVVNPVVAIRADYPGGIFAGPSANVAALSYFFNVSSPSSLAFKWSVNGIAAENAENPDAAIINLGKDTLSGTKIRVQVDVKNPGDSTAASAYTNLIYQKI